jgi:hypothetical protein
VGQLVALVLQRLDPSRLGLAVRQILGEGGQFLGCLHHVGGGLMEQVEEGVFFRDDLE